MRKFPLLSQPELSAVPHTLPALLSNGNFLIDKYRAEISPL
jgi:hypothetical protein